MQLNNEITYLSQDFKKLRIKKKTRDKKYLINSLTKNFLRESNHIFIGIIPFRCVHLPIYNKKKEFFMHQTDIISTDKGMISIPVDKKCTNLKEIIIEYCADSLDICISQAKINKILDVENNQIQIYTIDLSDYKIFQQNGENNLINKMSKLSLENKNIDLKNKGFTVKTLLDFYNNITVHKTKNELYQNIMTLRQNKYHLANIIPLFLKNNNCLKIKYHLLYQRLYR